MVQAANSEVVFDVRIPLDKAVAELKANEPRLVAGVQQMAARASKAGRLNLGVSLDEAATRKRMADLIRDMRNQARNAKIEMEARVRLFGGGPGGPPVPPNDEGGTSLKDIFGKRSQLGQMTSLLRGGGAVVALTIALDQLGRMTGQMRALRDEIRLGEKSAGDMASAFGKSIPVLGKIVTIGEELRELFTGENFNLARTIEVSSAVGAATQQMFAMQRDVENTMAQIEQGRMNYENQRRILNAPVEDRPKLQAELDATQAIADFDKESKRLTKEVSDKTSAMLNAPLSAEQIKGVQLSDAVKEQLRDKSITDLRNEAAKTESQAKDAIPNTMTLYDEKLNKTIVRREQFDSLTDDQKRRLSESYVTVKNLIEASDARKSLDQAINQIRDNETAVVNRIMGVDKNGNATEGGRTAERAAMVKLQEAQEAERKRIDTFSATQLDRDLKIQEARGNGNIRQAERLELQKQLADREREAAAIGEESLKKQRAINEEILAQYDKRVMLARAESQITEGARIKAAQQRLNRDFEGAEKTERDARNQIELMHARQNGGMFGMFRELVAQQLEGAAGAADKRLAKEVAVDASIANLRQAQLRSAQRYYDAEVEAIEEAYRERERLAKSDEERTIAINERAARMTELNAQAEQRARDAGFEANQIRLRREGKDTEAQRAAIMRQAEDELKQVGSNANAREAIFARTKEQLLELQDMEARRLGSGSWAADSIYSLGLGRSAPGNTLTAVNQAALASLDGSGGTSGAFAVAGIAGSIAKAASMVAMLPSEIAAMNNSISTTPGRTDADAKVEIRGEAITYLKTIAENTGKGAVFSA